MRILIASYVFHPLLGGIATSSSLIAQEFAAAGHEVRVITTTAGDDLTAINYRLLRHPGVLGLWRQVAWCDVFLSVHLSVRLAWPLMLLRRPWVIAHHSWLTQNDGSVGWMERFKRRLLRRASCISVSQAVADHVDAPSVVIGPPYNDVMFWRDSAIPRTRKLLFVGRLVSSKGLNILLAALAELRGNGQSPGLTIVGGGPEMEPAQRLEPLMDTAQVRDWLAAGHDIGAHTVTHAHLTQLPLATAREEITASKKMLEDLFSRAVTDFAYPYGEMNPVVRALVAEAGFERAWSVEPKVITRNTDPFALPRFPVVVSLRQPLNLLRSFR